MRLTRDRFDKIAGRYGSLALDCHGNHNPLEAVLDQVIRRHGGLFAVLTEDARRDLIVTLGDNNRHRNAFNARQRAKFSALRVAAGEQAPALPMAAE